MITTLYLCAMPRKRLIARMATQYSYIEKCVAKMPVINPFVKHPRVWESVGVPSESTDDPSLKFKILSYNVLAQGLLESNPYLFVRCSQSSLRWEDRFARLYKEITDLSPDIICLQEVQVSHIHYYSKFEDMGYYGIYKKKTGETVIDGCAIYFKITVFKLEDVTNVEFYQPHISLLDRHHIGIIVKLTPWCLPHSPIIVANTHLLYDPKKAIVRLAQMKLFLAEIDRIAYVIDGRESGYLPIILTGDFNSSPDSQVIELLDEGQTDVQELWDYNEWKKIGITDNCQHLSVYLNRLEGRTTNFSELQIYNSEFGRSRHHLLGQWGSASDKFYFGMCDEMYTSGILSYPLHFRSVYDKLKTADNVDHEKPNAQNRWTLVDYMYCNSCTNLRPLERLQLPTTKQNRALSPLPNEQYGSDHLPLVAVFELNSKKAY